MSSSCKPCSVPSFCRNLHLFSCGGYGPISVRLCRYLRVSLGVSVRAMSGRRHVQKCSHERDVYQQFFFFFLLFFPPLHIFTDFPSASFFVYLQWIKTNTQTKWNKELNYICFYTADSKKLTCQTNDHIYIYPCLNTRYITRKLCFFVCVFPPHASS